MNVMVTNSFLTANERGISGSLTDIGNDTDSEDWWKAKTGNASAALRIVKKIWKNENFEKFLQIIDKKCVPFCISVPSTSGSNMIADTLAEYIAKSINGIFISGKTLYKINTEIQMKYVDRKEKLFSERNYTKIKNVDFLVEQQVIVVDDIIISGASIFEFIRTLRKDGIKTTSIACLFGDATVTPSHKSICDFINILDKINIKITLNDIIQLFAQGEILNIINTIKNLSSEEEKNAFAVNLQRVLNNRLAEAMGSNSFGNGGRFRECHRGNHERISDGISPLSSFVVPDGMGRG